MKQVKKILSMLIEPWSLVLLLAAAIFIARSIDCGSHVTEWTCAHSPEETWMIAAEEGLEARFMVATHQSYSSTLALDRASVVIAPLGVPSEDQEAMSIVVANAFYEIMQLYIQGTRAELLPYKVSPKYLNAFADLLKAEMAEHESTIQEAYPCVMPVILDQIKSGKL